MAKTGHRGNAREVTYAKISDRALKALSLINILKHSNAIKKEQRFSWKTN